MFLQARLNLKSKQYGSTRTFSYENVRVLLFYITKFRHILKRKPERIEKAMLHTKDVLQKYGQASAFLPTRFRSKVLSVPDDDKLLAEEFRLRAGQGFSVCIAGKERLLSESSSVNQEDLCTVLELATGHSVHTAQESIREGYVTVCGGHRIGICGTVIKTSAGLFNIRDLSSVAIRIAKGITTAAENIADITVKDGVFCNTLIISPPGYGKTTTLRDLVRRLSDNGFRVSLVDERGELAAKYRGIAQFDVGRCTDVLDGIDKASGAMLMLRAMTPDIIALDEITAERDVRAICSISNCGVGILATAHGESAESLFARPMYRRLYDLRVFKTVITLGRNGRDFTHSVTEL